MKKTMLLCLNVSIFLNAAFSKSHRSESFSFSDRFKTMISSKQFYIPYCVQVGLGTVRFIMGANLITSVHGRPAGAATTAFVKHSLRAAGFRKKEIKTIKVRTVAGEGFASFGDTIFVPITDDSLEKAQRCYQLQNVPRAIQEENAKEGAVFSKQFFGEKTSMCLNKNLLGTLQFTGRVITEKTIPFWRAVLVHEMSHIVHGDNYVHGLVRIVAAPFLYSSLLYKINVLKLFKLFDLDAIRLLFTGSAIVDHFTFLPIGKHQEYRSDQEIIKRVKDPKILEAIAEMFQCSANLNGQGLSLLQELADVHPNCARRAEYFRRAAQRITSQKLNTYE